MCAAFEFVHADNPEAAGKPIPRSMGTGGTEAATVTVYW